MNRTVRLRQHRFTRVIIIIAVLAAFVWAALQVALEHKRSATIEHLSTIKVSVYGRAPSRIGRTTKCLPRFAQELLTQCIGADAMEYPASLMATEIGASDIDALVHDVKNLPSVQSIVLMEGQLQQADVVRLQRSLPNVDVIQAAFISGAVYVR